MLIDIIAKVVGLIGYLSLTFLLWFTIIGYDVDMSFAWRRAKGFLAKHSWNITALIMIMLVFYTILIW